MLMLGSFGVQPGLAIKAFPTTPLSLLSAKKVRANAAKLEANLKLLVALRCAAQASVILLVWLWLVPYEVSEAYISTIFNATHDEISGEGLLVAILIMYTIYGGIAVAAASSVCLAGARRGSPLQACLNRGGLLLSAPSVYMDRVPDPACQNNSVATPRVVSFLLGALLGKLLVWAASPFVQRMPAPPSISKTCTKR